MKQQGEDEPFFITDEVKAELIAAGYVFEPPGHVRTTSLSETLAGLTDEELASWPGVLTKGETERRQGRISEIKL